MHFTDSHHAAQQRAGRNPAMTVTAKIARMASRIVLGSCGKSPKSRLFNSRVPIHVSGNPTAIPARTTNSISRNTMLRIVACGARSCLRPPH